MKCFKSWKLWFATSCVLMLTGVTLTPIQQLLVGGGYNNSTDHKGMTADKDGNIKTNGYVQADGGIVGNTNLTAPFSILDADGNIMGSCTDDGTVGTLHMTKQNGAAVGDLVSVTSVEDGTPALIMGDITNSKLAVMGLDTTEKLLYFNFTEAEPYTAGFLNVANMDKPVNLIATGDLTIGQATGKTSSAINGVGVIDMDCASSTANTYLHVFNSDPTKTAGIYSEGDILGASGRYSGAITFQDTFNVQTGTNKITGKSTMVGGTVTVSTTKVTANSIILLTPQNSSGTPGSLSVSTRTAGTSFTILSTSASDTRDVGWFIVEPFT